MDKALHYLSAIYNEKRVHSILESAINQEFEIYFINELTKAPQPLTLVQLMGIKKFGGVNILLETGQTYQIGLEIESVGGTYQAIYLTDLIVSTATLEHIKRLG